MPSSSSLHFEKCGGILEPLDDGHVPETFASKSPTGTSSDAASPSIDSEKMGSLGIVRYPKHHRGFDTGGNNDGSKDCNGSNIPSVQVYDDPLPSQLLDEVYRCTTTGDVVNACGNEPWGAYVTFEEALEWRRRHVGSDGEVHIQKVLQCNRHDESDVGSTAAKTEERHRHNLAVAVVALLLVDLAESADDLSRAKEPAVTIPSNSNPPCLLGPSSTLSTDAHGVAVWALSSSEGSEVRYHIDYAELLRYEHNITVPPLLAGTVHCTDFGSTSCSLVHDGGKDWKREDNATGIMDGGDFAVNLGGLCHYAMHGYKGIRSGDDCGGWVNPFADSVNTPAGCAASARARKSNSKAPYHDKRTGWVTIPYFYNRAIFHDGHLPHLSTPIKSISKDVGGKKKSRVILGLNVFGHDVGPCVSKAPEHSNAFRRKIKMYRVLLGKSAPCQSADTESTVNSSNSERIAGLTIESIRKNKSLSKLLILAKRERVKQDLRERQKRLTKQIWDILDEPYSGQNRNSDERGRRREAVAVPVAEIMERLSVHRETWPSPADIQVHLHHMIIGGDNTSARSTSSSSVRKICCTARDASLDECGLLSPSARVYIIEN